MYKFGVVSKKKLDTAHEDLIKIMETALAVSQVDFGVSCGHRTVEEQKALFKQGASKKDGVNNKSKHNEYPSMAVDIYVYVESKKNLAFDKTYLAYIGGVITATASTLYDLGVVKHRLRWGFNWDGDGEIGTDQTFQDMPHFELV